MLKVAGCKLVVGKEEYYPFSAEMHYFRVSKRYWSICFERIRKAGFRIISTRVPWNLHEPVVGDFDFMGVTGHSKDLVVFLELAREFGLKVILHPGPFIGSDWKNGGYPDFLYNSPEILAKAPDGEPVRTSAGEDKKREDYVFSPLHPRFLNHVKRYLGALTDVIKSYIYPKGPVIMVRLDNGLFSFHPDQSPDNLNPFCSDYNEHLIGTLFPDYLRGKYGDIKKLNQLYGHKYRDFKDISPPVELKISKPHNLIKYFDWISFKERTAGEFVSKLKELYLSFEVSPLFSTDLFLSRDFSLPFNWQASESDELFTGINLLWQDDYVALTRHLRYFATCCRFPWASEFAVGSSADLPKDAAKYFPIPPQKVKFLLATALASGLRGFNHFMFVERDHWYDAPLANDGTIRPTFDLIKKLSDLGTRIQLESLKSAPQLGLAVYRPYLWYDFLFRQPPARTSNPFPYIQFLLSKTHEGLSQDLINLRLDHCMPDLWLKESLEDVPALMVPSAEFMDAETQQLLVDSAKAGKTLILFGLLPRFDLNMKPCKLLSDSLKLQTKIQSSVASVKASGEEFTALLYGYVRGAKRSQILAKHQDRPVGAVMRLGKGRVFLFTFDISAQLHHPKLSFLEQALSQAGIQSQIYCDDPGVELVLQRSESQTILYLINPPGATFCLRPVKNDKKVILRFDPRKLGIKGKRLRLTDLLGDEVIRTTPQELKTGLMMQLPSQDSRMFLIEAK
jgi:beta-galactosidase